MAKWVLPEVEQVESKEEGSKELYYTIEWLREKAAYEHMAAAWGFSGVGFWLEKAADHLETEYPKK